MFLNLLALDIFIECTKADSIKNSFQFPGLHFPTLWADPCSWCYAAARLVDAGDLDMFLNYRCASWGVRLKNTSIQKQYSSCAFYFFGNLNFRHRLGLWLKPINSHFKISPNFDYMVSFVPKKKKQLTYIQALYKPVLLQLTTSNDAHGFSGICGCWLPLTLKNTLQVG